MDKELDPHIMPEQQYVSKVQTPKGARPKTVKTLVRDSPHKVRVANDPVMTTKLTDTAEPANKNPRTYEKLPYQSPRVRLVQLRALHVGIPQKGDSIGRV